MLFTADDGPSPAHQSKSLNSFQIPFPLDEAEQTAIATILSDMDTKIAALETKLVKTRQLKQGIMYNLLTGKIRLLRLHKNHDDCQQKAGVV